MRQSQVVKGLECQAKEFGHCSQGTGETQKAFEQGREMSDLNVRKLLCEEEWIGGSESRRAGEWGRRLVDEILRRPGGKAMGLQVVGKGVSHPGQGPGLWPR